MQYTIDGVRDFNLDHIFDCGQCFRWEKQEDGSYIGPAMGRIVQMSFSDERLTIDNCSEEDFNGIWKNYLDMETDYSHIKQELCADDDIIKRASEYGYGIRILRQDFWETVVSFIISQNNNIPRIKGCIENLSASFGEKIGEYRGREYFDIPNPEIMASLTVCDLSSVKLGYRAPYLIKTAEQMIEQGGPDRVKERLLKSAEPSDELQQFCGIGPKVASCIALFGLARTDAFPIDVWMRRVMNRLYGIEEKNVKGMGDYAEKHFGQYGGIAQQYLFYYIRSL